MYKSPWVSKHKMERKIGTKMFFSSYTNYVFFSLAATVEGYRISQVDKRKMFHLFAVSVFFPQSLIPASLVLPPLLLKSIYYT